MNRNQILGLAVFAAALANVASDEKRFALALRQWQRNRTPAALFHVATSGFFLARDVTALG